LGTSEEETDMREQDVKELKEGMKEVTKILHGVDKTVSVHSAQFDTLKNVKEVAERSHESTKSAHLRIDRVEQDMKDGFDEIKKQYKEQFDDFKELVESSNKSHEENFKNIKTFAWKVFFLFATPFAIGIVSVFWFFFNKGIGIKG
jgi:hypothetical protein